ncbi:hypothetical protein [Ectobacillus ponti]|uniref:Uncharacterized protein n=1 Tax=Ectobacillus ponti TaxID=2961894 RepID=A0AA41X8Q0_9BACI|nr:hypothetical protein [Ectobacillus ponti]MCP8970777.1 hypothetical protein [Ectobacillus ponti]
MLDYIGFLVSEEEKNTICENAERMRWKVEQSERRTFIATPYRFRTELQTVWDAIDSLEEGTTLERITVTTRTEGLDKNLVQLFGQALPSFISGADTEL